MLIGMCPTGAEKASAAERRGDGASDGPFEESSIRLEISAAKLHQLLMCGAVGVTDFRCLDHASKCSVRTLCLHACAHRLNENNRAGTIRRSYSKRPS